jgi:RNA polymerase sigma factor (sigma-70 family)
MRLGRRIPQLSLEVCGTEVYPLIVREITRRVVNRTERDAGSATLEDFLGEAVFQVLNTVKRRYSERTRVTTYIFKRIGGSFLDMMRREMRYASKQTLATDCAEGRLPDQIDTEDFEAELNNRLLWAKVRVLLRTSLSPLQREVLMHHYFHDQSFAAIAELLWIDNPDDCRVIHDAALAELRRYFPDGLGRFVA